MKFGVLSAVWQRPQLTELFLDRLAHLREELGCVPAVVGTDNMFRGYCEDRGIMYADFTNKPLGAKWNFGMLQFEDVDVSHVMILGSDDFPSDAFVKFSMEFAKGKDFTGCKDLYMYGAHPGRRGFGGLFYFRYKGYLVGPGRCLSRHVIERMNWQPWNVNKNYGLDGSVVKHLNLFARDAIRGSFLMKDNELFLMDIKTSGNISGIPGGAKPEEGDIKKMLTENLPEKEALNLIDFLITRSAIKS